MAVDYTLTALLASVRRRGQLPNATDQLSTTDLTALMNEAMQEYVVPLLIDAKEEYLVTYADQTIVSGTEAYAIPARAVGGKLRDVQVSTTDGKYRSISRVEPEQALEYEGGGFAQAYKIRGNSVVLVPSPTEAGTLRLHYYRRPSVLVSTGYTTVTVVNGVTVTCAANLTGSTFDLIDDKPQFSSVADDKAGTFASTTLTLASAATGLAVGDYVCVPGESPVAQIPLELHPLLCQRTTELALEAIGDDRSAVASKKTEQMARRALALLTPRGEGKGRTIVNYNAPGFRRPRGR